MIIQSIKFFTIFLLAFNVFAGGDDRDKSYYEALDEELAKPLKRSWLQISLIKLLLMHLKSSLGKLLLMNSSKNLLMRKLLPLHLLQHTNPKLDYDAKVAERMDALAEAELEIDAFEAQLEAELAAARNNGRNS